VEEVGRVIEVLNNAALPIVSVGRTVRLEAGTAG
jgi:hypothetical protein